MRPHRKKQNYSTQDTSWQKSAKWYHKIVGDEGHYYHQHVIVPKLLKLIDAKKNDRVLDLGCGQGVLARQLPGVAKYVGVDLASDLIEQAQRANQLPNVQFLVKDVTKPLPLPANEFSIAVIMLALQNMADPKSVIENAAKLLDKKGRLFIVLNHPCFRIPRQSGWDIDEKTKQQFRWINRYLSPLKIPITMNPGGRKTKTTWSFHFPLEKYIQDLNAAGFAVVGLEEWASDKESVGKASKMENRARAEFPLFMCIVAEKR